MTSTSATRLCGVALWVSAVAAEILWLSIRFDAQRLVDQPVWPLRLIGFAPHALQLLIAIVAAAALVGGRPLREQAREMGARLFPPLGLVFVGLHAGAFVFFVRVSAFVFEREFTSPGSAWAWSLAWIALAFLSLVTWALALSDARAWLSAAKELRPAIVKATMVGSVLWSGALFTQHLWTSLAQYTFRAVSGILALIYPVVVSQPAKLIVGTPAFKVAIAPECSGLEGIGLVLGLFGIYFWLFRRELRFPAAFILLPAGALAMWMLNVVRIATLIIIGSSGWRTIALGGFHSQAGWVTFTIVALGMTAITLHVPWFRVAAAGRPLERRQTSRAEDLTTAYLLPLAAMLATGIATGAVSGGVEWLYPLRLVVVAAVLWIFRNQYRELVSRLSLPSAAIGAIVFLIWIALVPTSGSAASRWPLALVSVPSYWAGVWLFVRILGFVVFVPIAEELAFRGFVARRVISAEFQRVPFGAFSWSSLVLSSVLFGALHGRFWVAGTIAGVLFAVAMYRRSSLGDAIQPHATANGLIVAYVLTTGRWGVWS